ncbi:glycosyltransferase family 2 protein [Kallotenue papyrolyticum]|uniref:glycosyltransferase family 2 protein n=1 Tax=Kallotenue papyrolyticum TaxID=1325125 RepID=UPI00047854E4|nr:glycosyltransferase family 2 protein [Kallotenue papyrolyticum]
MTQLSVIIPAYNEEDGIAEIVERVLKSMPSIWAAGVDQVECIVVDDGSRDRTAEIAARYPVRLIRQPNRGYGGAIKTGFRHAQGDLLAFLDADGTYPPEHFAELCKAALGGADIVIGSRMAGRESEMPLVRRIGNLFFAALLNLVGCARISDSASGMRVLRRDALPQLYPLPDGLNFTPAMSTRALHEQLTMVEVPIPYKERLGRSKLSVVRDGFRFLHAIIWTTLTYNPVRIFGGMGLLLFVAGLILGAMGLLAGSADNAWPFPQLFMALVLLVAGSTLVTSGRLYNYIVSLFYRRPIRQGILGRPLFRPNLERIFFGVAGLVSIGAGIGLYLVAVAYHLTDATAAAPWFLPAMSALLVLNGIQLIASWVLALMLQTLSQRDLRMRDDLGVTEPAPVSQPAAAIPHSAA